MAVYAPSPKPPSIESASLPKPTPHTGLPKAFTTVLAVILDYACIALGFLFGFLCYRVYHGVAWPDSTHLLIVLTVQYWLIFVFLARAQQLYSQSHTLLQVRDTENILMVSCLCFIGLAVEIYIGKLLVPRIALCVGWLATVFLLLAQKHLSRRIFVRMRAAMATQRRVLILGTGRDARRIFSYLDNSPDLGMIPIAFVDESKSSSRGVIYGHDYVHRSHAPVICSELSTEMIQELNVSHVFIAETEISHHRMSELNSLAIEHDLNISFVGTAQPISIERHGAMHVMDGLLTMSYAGLIADRRIYHAFKRCFDFVGALLLLTLTAPLWVFIALWIRRTSTGPVFFRQERVGHLGHTFTMFKFRTMYTDAPKYGRSPEGSDDHRITPAGRFLRKASLDELPQLFNVLRGDMSLVGPRPEMPYVTEGYNLIERRRLVVPQGLTGFWQLSADRKYSIHESLEYDLYYIENRGFFLDLAILLHTALFAMKGI